MYERRIIPYNQITSPPFMRIDKSILSRKIEQAKQLRPPFFLIHTIDVRSVKTCIK